MTITSPPQTLSARIQHDASADGIDLSVLPFTQEAITSIIALSTNIVGTTIYDFTNATRIDTHTHPIPDWFRQLELNAAGRATPSWNVSSHFQFMSEHQIAHSVLCISTPQANAFLSETNQELRRKKTVALARLLNEFTAELCRLYPDRFSWMAVTPLPYVDSAIVEMKRSLEKGAVGVGVLTNHEGLYPGDASFSPLFQFLQKRAERKEGGDGREIVFIHPTEPIIKLPSGQLINSRPSPLRSGLGEFYFETARAISSITVPSSPSSPPSFPNSSSTTSTILAYPSLHYRISHGAGAFPDISHRFLLGFPSISAQAREVYRERFWYDSAGPVWPDQVKGLMAGMGVGVSQMVFGTDYPYGIGFWNVDANISGLAEAEGVSEEEKEGIFWRNAKSLWRHKIRALE